jgi:hypothetical protein
MLSATDPLSHSTTSTAITLTGYLSAAAQQPTEIYKVGRRVGAILAGRRRSSGRLAIAGKNHIAHTELRFQLMVRVADLLRLLLQFACPPDPSADTRTGCRGELGAASDGMVNSYVDAHSRSRRAETRFKFCLTRRSGQ